MVIGVADNQRNVSILRQHVLLDADCQVVLRCAGNRGVNRVLKVSPLVNADGEIGFAVNRLVLNLSAPRSCLRVRQYNGPVFIIRYEILGHVIQGSVVLRVTALTSFTSHIYGKLINLEVRVRLKRRDCIINQHNVGRVPEFRQRVGNLNLGALLHPLGVEVEVIQIASRVLVFMNTAAADFNRQPGRHIHARAFGIGGSFINRTRGLVILNASPLNVE